MRFLRAHTETYSQMASGRPLISNPEHKEIFKGRQAGKGGGGGVQEKVQIRVLLSFLWRSENIS